MKMKKTLILMAAAASVVLTGCTESDLSSDTSLAKESSSAIEFSAKARNTGITRAGFQGDISTDGVLQAHGFGVFAYYTKTYGYGGWQATTYSSEDPKSTADHVADFMYNQKVTYSAGNWTYSPLKYWPNEFSNTDVDDQEKDANDKQAWGGTQYNGTLENGGNVTFFAYAPYVYVTTDASAKNADNTTAATLGKEKKSDGANSEYEAPATGETQDGTNGVGITSLTANTGTGDPILSYKLDVTGQNVDLLWGTLSGTNTNVNNEGNIGVTGTSDNSAPAGQTTYAAELLKDYTTNANLTKQRTNGTVGFAFKHALAKIGGSTVSGATGAAPNGLMIKLDIDNNGAESGGARESFTATSTDDSWRTIVTVNSIMISNDLDGDGSIENSGEKGDEEIVMGGNFNLATGKWQLNTKSADKYEHLIATSTSVANYSAVLSDAIKETGKPTASSEADFFSKTNAHTGVTETAQNVYGTESNPLVFIPGTTPTMRITIDYIVRTYDANLTSKYSEVHQVISKVVTFPTVKLNKLYSVLIHLGLTSVKFTATVSDWSVDGDDNNNGVIDITEELDVQDVHLPINVSSLAVTYSATPTTGIASTDNSSNVFTVSTAKYYEGEVETPVTPSTLTITSTPDATSWLTLNAPSAVVKAANTTFANRSTTLTITKSPYICDQAVTVTQYGRIPADDASIALTTASFTSLDNSAHTDESYSVTGATLTNYYEADANGAKTGDKVTTPAASLIDGTDIQFNKAVFVDDAGNKVGWITAGEGKFSTTTNGTGFARKAYVAYYVNGKLVKTGTTITQNP